MYYLYFIYNKLNGKIYVGITNNLSARWKRHISTSKSKNQNRKCAIHLAIAKYGVHNFIFKEIEKLDGLDTATKREIEWIKNLKDNKYQLYNETDGGQGHLGVPWTDEQRQKASERNSGSGNPMYGVQLFGETNGNYGKKMKPHVKEKLLACRRKLTDEQILEIRALYATGNYTQTFLSQKFEISLTTIHRIVHNKDWGNVPRDKILTKKNLTEEQVKNIRELYATNNYTQKDLAKLFNISVNHVSRIILKKKWKNI